MSVRVSSPTQTHPLRRLASRIGEISTLPQVAQRVIEIASDDHSGAHDLKQALESDVSLSARVLRIVNSSAFGLRQRIANLQMAVTYLGFRQIRNLALTACIAEIFRNSEQIGSYRRDHLWRHSVSVGITARMIAMRRKIDQFEEIFLGGLLHDIGIVFADQYDHPKFRKMVLSLRPGESLEQFERTHLGYTHSELGELVGEKWNFPAMTRSAIRFHLDPGKAPAEFVRAVHCVALANYLITIKGLPSVGMNLTPPPTESVTALGLARSDLEAILLDLDDELSRNAALLGL